jgi:anaerobic selenocysteine-containing dehydrogenase
VHVHEGRAVRIDGNRDNPITAGFICGKVRHFVEHVYGPERLLTPGRRIGAKGEGRFEPISWDEALSTICDRIRETIDRYGGEAILPLCYGGSNGMLTHNSTDARLFRRLGASRLALTVCAAPTGRAASGLYGKMHGVAMDDFVHSRLIVVWGANPSESGIHLVPFIRQAQANGARLVVIDPRRTPLARQADLHLPVRPGTDVVVALSLIRELFETGSADLAFLNEHATGVEKLRRRAESWALARAAEVSGISTADLESFRRMYITTTPAVIRCGWGLERNRNGGSSVAAVLALPAVAGKFGVRGGGYTMSNSGAWSLTATRAANEPEPSTRLVNMNQAGQALLDQQQPVKLLFVYNGNPLSTLPNQEAMRRGLAREDLFTVVYDQVLTDTAQYADLVLPATTFLEHTELRRGYGAAYLNRAEPAIAPVGQSRPNYEVFAELCQRLGLARPEDPVGADGLIDAILNSSPDAAFLREKLRERGFVPPSCGTNPIQFVDLFPNTPDRKIHLVPEDLDREAPGGLYHFQPDPATPEYPLALLSPATDRTISSMLGQLIRREIPVELHPEDAASRGIAEGDEVRVYNSYGEVRCLATLNADLRPGVALLPKGLWSRHTRNGATANALAPDTLTDLGGGACFNDARVQVEKAGR